MDAMDRDAQRRADAAFRRIEAEQDRQRWDAARKAVVERGKTLFRERAQERSEHRQPAAERGLPERSDGPRYFTKRGVTVESNDVVDVERHWELRPTRCKSVFCKCCTKTTSMRIRERVRPVIESFRAVLMLTLTVDPKLFPCPEAAYRYLRKKRAVAELIRALVQKKVLLSDRYFAVVEWQKDTQQAHFHVLVEAEFVPHKLLARLWGLNRPKSARPWADDEGNRYSYLGSMKNIPPEFGHVRISRTGKFASKAHAANYATKYLTKVPEHGFPEWVTNFRGRIRRFATSRGFFGTTARRVCVKSKLLPASNPGGVEVTIGTPPTHGPECELERHKPDCFCPRCRGDHDKWAFEERPTFDGGSEIVRVVVPALPRVVVIAGDGKPLDTVGERVARCGQGSRLIEVTEVTTNKGEVHEMPDHHVLVAAIAFDRVCEIIGRTPHRSRLPIALSELEGLLKKGTGYEVSGTGVAERDGPSAEKKGVAAG